MTQTNLKQTLIQLNQNLNILREREAKYSGNAPLDLLNQITDHQTAIQLTEQTITGDITEAEWREKMRPLLVNIRDRSEANPTNYGVVIDTMLGDIHIYNQPAAQAVPPRRGLYIIAGLLVGIAVNVAVNLLSAAIQQRYFAEQFSSQTMWGLAIFAVIGSLVGLWLSGLVPIPASAAPPQAKPIPTSDPNRVMITRFRAFLSLGKLRGKGITMTNILLIGSKLDIDTRG